MRRGREEWSRRRADTGSQVDPYQQALLELTEIITGTDKIDITRLSTLTGANVALDIIASDESVPVDAIRLHHCRDGDSLELDDLAEGFAVGEAVEGGVDVVELDVVRDQPVGGGCAYLIWPHFGLFRSLDLAPPVTPIPTVGGLVKRSSRLEREMSRVKLFEEIHRGHRAAPLCRWAINRAERHH